MDWLKRDDDAKLGGTNQEAMLKLMPDGLREEVAAGTPTHARMHALQPLPYHVDFIQPPTVQWQLGGPPPPSCSSS